MESMNLNARSMQQLRSSSQIATLKVRKTPLLPSSTTCPLCTTVTEILAPLTAEIQDHWLHNSGRGQAAQRAEGGGADCGTGRGGWRDL
jgi:hypothetical protein